MFIASAIPPSPALRRTCASCILGLGVLSGVTTSAFSPWTAFLAHCSPNGGIRVSNIQVPHKRHWEENDGYCYYQRYYEFPLHRSALSNYRFAIAILPLILYYHLVVKRSFRLNAYLYLPKARIILVADRHLCLS